MSTFAMDGSGSVALILPVLQRSGWPGARRPRQTVVSEMAQPEWEAQGLDAAWPLEGV